MTEFATLLHAYGRATDTPGHLAALASGSPAALGHLWGAIIHQGTPWTATAPAALAVAEMVGGLESPDLRAGLLEFLAAVAEAGRPYPRLTDLAPPPGFDFDAVLAAALEAGEEDDLYGDETTANALYLTAVQGCYEITPTLLTTAVESLADPAPSVRSAAAHLAAACASPSAASALAVSLDALAAQAGPDERAALVLAMGELGLSPAGYLGDAHPGVRACAALAPALAADARATAELLAALGDPAAIEFWFERRPPQFHGHLRFTLIGAVIERGVTPADLLPAALAVVPLAHVFTVRSDWGRLLVALRPDPAAQHRYLAALVDRPDLWDPRNGTVRLVFRDAGLPYDREACRALITN
ncbi:hypothetical protein ACTI_83270 [Actinoplanes sp. OR16]|uniref:hypothetical protein n=1 Tax=Actinoplanes sp. OR16 TaxID=946334 RepID=UPI000F6C9637|nr:hypothetical protein [Actinoplanes sp. OR16]BBH71642.1 hypothetical protein ACTI_83270 [Actinoplanes sp. OR16]